MKMNQSHLTTTTHRVHSNKRQTRLLKLYPRTTFLRRRHFPILRSFHIQRPRSFPTLNHLRILRITAFSESDYLTISVSDPQKETELSSSSLVPGATYYFSYLITTFTDFHSYAGNEFNVQRRFKDVVALSDRLADNYRGFCVPLCPDKSVVESQVMQQHDFVEQRRVALEKYLRQLALHPVIRRSEELRVLLKKNLHCRTKLYLFQSRLPTCCQ